VTAVLLLVSFGAFLRPGNVKAVQTQVPADFLPLTASPTASSTPTTSTQPPSQTTNGINTVIIGALIALVGTVIAALIAGGFAVYQTRRNNQLQRRNEEAMVRLRKDVEVEYKDKEQKKQQEDVEKEANEANQKRAKTISLQSQNYRNALRQDPDISLLKILDMSEPFEITSIYVPLELYRTRPSYELDKGALIAQARRDPNALLRVDQEHPRSHFTTTLNANDAIRRFKRCVIVGDPGAGKTTLLKNLALKSLNGQLIGLPDLPIYVELNAFASSGYHDLMEFASTKWYENYRIPVIEARDCIEDNLKLGKVLLLLDALDETMIGTTASDAKASYQRVVDAIKLFVRNHPQLPVVVTSRKAGYQQAPLPYFTDLEVLAFHPEDIKQFVNNWFAYQQDPEFRAKATELNTKLERNLRIQVMAANPLLLSLIVNVYEAQLDLPDRRAKLYEECVETLLARWDTKRGIKRLSEFKPEQKRQLLEKVAWHFHTKGLRYFPKNELLMEIARYLPAMKLPKEQNNHILEEIAAENGLLKEQAQGWYGFLHLSLQEYFVANYTIDHDQLNAPLLHRGEPWWEEVILLYTGCIPDADPLLQKLLGQDKETLLPEDIFHTNLILAGHCLAAHPHPTSLRQEITSSLFNTLKNTPFSLVRQQVAEALAEIGGTEVNKDLLELLRNERLDPDVRGRIADALGTLGDPSVAPTLLQMLSNEKLNLYVRGRIAFTLGTLGDRSMIPDLLQMYSNDQLDSFVHWNIASALGTLGQHSMFPDLLQMLPNERIDSFVRRRIAFALGTLGEPSVTPTLLQMLSNEQISLFVRQSIASALGTLGDGSVIPDLLQMLPEKLIDLEVRRSIAGAIGTLADDESTAHSLAERLQTSDIANDIHQALWKVSRRAGVRVFITDEPLSKKVEVIKRADEPKSM
jgi:HEAT repeat protein/energy-coupling factor transporter ATP-binding protein EcfA2